MQWNIQSTSPPSSLEELKAILLANRQISDFDRFLKPLEPSKLSLSDVGIHPEAAAEAVVLLKEAKETQKSVLVFGDYDADGISATTVMWQTLHFMGINATPFIPHREKHGYGLSDRAIDDILKDKKPDLILTVDNGIVAHEPIARLKAEGIKVIITDHHQPEHDPATKQPFFPPADAVVHTTQLCGTTVAWMLAKELAPETVEESLDMCGLATIADQVPLLEANRSFAYWGIEAIKHTERVGLQSLAEVAGVELKTVTTNGINYGLVPRINAMGRVSHGMDALRLMCTNSKKRADQLVETLQVTNLRRQDLTGTYLSLAKSEAAVWEHEHIIISASTEFHEGVIGLIAGRLMEEYFKPAVVIAIGDTVAKASARSIDGVNIVELIREVRDDLLEVGGHPMAAGFGLLPEKIEIVTQRLQLLAKEQITTMQLQPTLRVECVLPPNLLSLELTEILKTFEPFGQANPTPLFAFQDWEVLTIQTLGKANQHLKMKLKHPTLEKEFVTLAWNQAFRAEKLNVGSKIDFAGYVEVNEWKQRQNLQIQIKDVRVE